MARISNKDNNPLLLDAYSLSKTVHLNGTYSWYTFAENILNTKSLKKTLLKNYENMFFEKLRSFNINNKLFLYSKIKTNYIIEPFIENSNFENRKLIVKMRRSDHVLEIERGRYNKINREQRICRQCHLNVHVIEDEEHFFFHCKKKLLYTKLMGNNHIQNLNFFFIFFVSYATCCPFHSQVISTEESGLNIAA
jgi:hypothetical protein